MPRSGGSITDVPGLRVGHYTDRQGVTGCTVVLCEAGAVAGVDVRGAAPGTRETDLLRPTSLVQRIQGVLLSGGSAFGLDAAAGVVRYLEERGRGHPVGVGVVPIVPAAILFDLALGDPKARPDAAAGYQACLAASDGPVAEGSVGAGTGATVGKALGLGRAMKGGLGTASTRVLGSYVVGALVAVNAYGDVVEPYSGRILAGARDAGGGFADTARQLKAGCWVRPHSTTATNTTIGVVATNAPLTKDQANYLAAMAQDGVALAVRPAHTMLDGDAIFALSVAEGDAVDPVQLSAIGAAAVQVVAEAIVRAVSLAEGLAGVPAAREVGRE